MPEDIDELLADMGNHPGWDHLRVRSREAMDRHFRIIARQLMAGVEIKPTVEYHRGFFAGMKFLLDNPTAEKRKLEQALKEAVPK